jgi:gliding motility-associated-like protein
MKVKKKIRLAFALFFLEIGCFIPIYAQQFSTQGSAVQTGPNTYQLTPDQRTRAGLITNFYPLNLTQNFTLNFELNFGNRTLVDGPEGGADGFAFTISRNCNPVLTIGNGLGIGGTPQTLIVEFDDFDNSPGLDHDRFDDHTGIYANGIISTLSGSVIDGNPPIPPCILPTCGNVEDGQWHQVEIQWEYLSATSQRITVFFDGNQRVVSTRNHIQNSFAGATVAYWSISSSTGDSRNLHQFRIPSNNNPLICPGETLTLTAPALGTNYSWSNGSSSTTNTATFMANTPGTSNYSCTYTDLCGNIRTVNFNVTVQTTPPVTPTFNPLGPFCRNETPTSLPASSTNSTPITGTWLPATINTNNTGTSTYTFTPAPGQCATPQTMNITINPGITPTFSPIGPYCLNASPVNLPVSSTNSIPITGTWSPSTISTNTTGTATYTFTPTAGQCASTQTLNITVNPIITPSFNSIGPLCQNSTPVNLPLSSTNATPILGTWSSPVVSTATPGTNTFLFTPASGQCATTQTMAVTINPTILPLFSAISPVCSGAAISLPPTSTNGYTGSWSPAINNTQTTTYTFTPTPGQASCLLTNALTVTVIPSPPAPILTITPPDCNVRTGSFSITPVLGAAYSYNSGTYNNVTNYTNLAPSSVHRVRLRNASGCESNETTITIPAAPLIPTGNVSASSAVICEGSNVVFTGSGGATYQWLLNGNPIPAATGAVYQTGTPGNYELDIFSADGCRIRVPAPPVNVLRKPKADFRPVSGCIGNTLRFTNISQTNLSGTVSYTWNFGDNTFSSDQNPIHVFTRQGVYNVSLKVTPLLCPTLADSVSFQVLIDAPFPNTRYPTVNTTANTNTRLNARNGAASYFWIPSFNLSNAAIAGPVFNGDQETEYIVQITKSSGCVSYDTLLVRIFPGADIQVPKAFTPNGDGHNDRLDVFLIDIKDFKFFKVFNRWGQLMFETNNSMQLWDGRYKGKEQPLETYVWIAEGIAEDGTVIRKRGQTVLIR